MENRVGMTSMKYEAWVLKNLKVSSRFGDEVLVFCPFHDNATSPACCVNIKKGLYVCYGCNAKGHISDMAKRVGTPLTAVYTAEAISDGLQRLRAGEAKAEAVRKLPEAWLDQFAWKRPHRYWTEERKFRPETCREWKLGYDRHSNAGVIPIRDVKGNLLGIVRRRLGKLASGEPRYLYPKGFKISWHLFGSHNLDPNATHDIVCITEGSLDTIALWEAGFHSVALLGARLHPHQLTILTGHDIDTLTLCLDNDEAGVHATQVVAQQVMAEAFQPYVWRTLNGKKDAASMSIMQRKFAVSTAENYLRLRLKASSE